MPGADEEPTANVSVTHHAMQDLFGKKRFLEAAALARTLPPGPLVAGPFADLWWHFCEELGDVVRAHDSTLAARLYALALSSHEKEGSQATGSGEGLASRANQQRLQRKLDALSP